MFCIFLLKIWIADKNQWFWTNFHLSLMWVWWKVDHPSKCSSLSEALTSALPTLCCHRCFLSKMKSCKGKSGTFCRLQCNKWEFDVVNGIMMIRVKTKLMEMIILIKLWPPYHHQLYQHHYNRYHHHSPHPHHAQIGQALVGMDREESGPVLTPEEEECLRWKNNFHQHQPCSSVFSELPLQKL